MGMENKSGIVSEVELTQKEGQTSTLIKEFELEVDATDYRDELYELGYNTTLSNQGGKWTVNGSITEGEPEVKWELQNAEFQKDLLKSDNINVAKMGFNNKMICEAALKSMNKFVSGSVITYPSFVGTIAQKNLSMYCWQNLVAGVSSAQSTQPILTTTYVCTQEWFDANISDLLLWEDDIIAENDIISFFDDVPLWVQAVLGSKPTGPWDVVKGMSYPDGQPDSTFGWKVNLLKVDETTKNRIQVTQRFAYGDYSMFVHPETNL